jgi:putative transposase
MPKANRVIEVGHCYHLTHRCHGRAFLLGFGKDRDVYREMLRRRLKDYGTPLLGYAITSNHVHLLVAALRENAISRMMDTLEGDFAQYYNLRKRRTGAFWGGRFHSTGIEPGGHLWRCLVYIELNMVRAGVVGHPREWEWSSYQELTGLRRRYRLVDRAQFLEATGQDPDSEQFRANYEAAIVERIGRREREPVWSESLAVGSAKYIEEVAAQVQARLRLEREHLGGGAWVLKEQRAQYA